MEQSLNQDKSCLTTATAAATSLLTESPANTTATNSTTTTATTATTTAPTMPSTQSQSHNQPSDPSQPQTHQIQTNTTSDETSAATAPEYPHQIQGVGGPTATAPFLQDFNLVAEAAKRAQMAVVMRDLEGISL